MKTETTEETKPIISELAKSAAAKIFRENNRPLISNSASDADILRNFPTLVSIDALIIQAALDVAAKDWQSWATKYQSAYSPTCPTDHEWASCPEDAIN